MNLDAYLPARLDPSQRLLMGPGPSNVHPRVYAALGAPVVGHLDPEFLDVMEDSKELLRQVFQTHNRVTISVSGTGSAGMEACFTNLIEPGDQVVVCACGVFGQRMRDVAERCGAEVFTARRGMGEAGRPGRGGQHPGNHSGRGEAAGHSSRRDLHRGPAAPGGDCLSRPRPRGPACRRRGDVPGRYRHRGGRRGHRCLLQRYSEMPELSTWIIPRYHERPLPRPDPQQAGEGPKLVPRPVDDRAVLGKRPRLSPHRPHIDELRTQGGRWPWFSRKVWKLAGRDMQEITRPWFAG